MVEKMRDFREKRERENRKDFLRSLVENAHLALAVSTRFGMCNYSIADISGTELKGSAARAGVCSLDVTNYNLNRMTFAFVLIPIKGSTLI